MGKKIAGEVIDSRGEVIGVFQLVVMRESDKGGGFLTLGLPPNQALAGIKLRPGDAPGSYRAIGSGQPRIGGDGIRRQVEQIEFTIPAALTEEPVSSKGTLTTAGGVDLQITATPRVIFDRPDAESTTGSADEVLEQAAGSDLPPGELATLYAGEWYDRVVDASRALPWWAKVAGATAAAWFILKFFLSDNKKGKK